MKRAALIVALLTGCTAIQEHPYVTTAIANSAVTVSAGVCAAECDNNTARGVSDGVLVGELALSSIASLWMIEFFASYVAESNQ